MISSTGVGSGLDIEGLVSKLMAAERGPTESRLLSREAALSSELSAFGTFKGALSTFQGTLANLTELTKFNQHIANSSDSAVVSASADTTAAAAAYDVTVDQLAKAQSLASAGYTALTDTVGQGTLTLRFGTTAYTAADPGPESYDGFTVNPDRPSVNIVIDATNNTLEGVRDTINDADAGVVAAIVNDGSGYRLLLSASDSGEANSLEITVADAGDGNNTDAAGLSALAFSSSANNLSQTVAAQDAQYSINGLALRSSSNNVTDAVDGVDFTLHAVSNGAPVGIAITEDRASVRQAIEGFVTGYNGLVSTINSLTAYDSESRRAAPLQGDYSARSISSRLRNVLIGKVEGLEGAFSTLAEIGITTKGDGTLAVDATKLDEQIKTNFGSIAGLFTAGGYSSDPSLRFESFGAKTQPGSYDVAITQAASGPQIIGDPISFPVLIDTNSDNLTLAVDGIDSGSIVISNTLYSSGASLAAELQTQINADSAFTAAGISVSVNFNAGRLELSTTGTGSAATLAITSVESGTGSKLGLSVASAAGSDMAGTIGGVPATVEGNTLIGADGSPAEGLRITVLGSALGPRGQLNITQGVALQLDSLLTGFLDAEGVLEARTDGLQDRVEDITGQRERLDLRMVAVEARYRAQFNALDGLLSQLQTTSSFLTQQLANLPTIGGRSNN